MTDSEGEAWGKLRNISGNTLAQEELAQFERNLAAEITRSGPLPMSEIRRLTGYEEKDCQAYVMQSGKLRITSDGSATIVKKHRRPVGGKDPGGRMIAGPRGGPLGGPSAMDHLGVFVEHGGVLVSDGRVGYLCLAEEFKLEEMRRHYEEAGYHTKLAFDVLHVSERQQASTTHPTTHQSPAGGSSANTSDVSKRKTKLCDNWLEGKCDRSGANCAFAHGEHELGPHSTSHDQSGQLRQRGAPASYGSTAERTSVAGQQQQHQHQPQQRNARAFDLFIFAYGAVVFWGYDQRHYQIVENDFVLSTSRINRYISGRYPAATVAANFPVWCNFSPDWRSLNPNEPDRVFSDKLLYDHFYIPQDSVDVKLCVSHGLAQSAKIDYIEIKVTELTQSCKPLPRELKDKGSVTISERKLLQLRGEVLFYRLMLKSGSDLLDEPELFWQFPWLKPFYTMTKQFFDISERVETLDAKLEAANQIVTMIGDQFNQRHGSRLEWIVIWLVMVEVIIGLLELILDIKPWVQ